MTDDDRLDAAAALYLPPEPESPSRARRFISELCRATRLSAEICETAALLENQLVTNAIIHGKTSATIEVHRPPDRLRVPVRDDNPFLPPLGTSATLSSESGRGLMIVSVLADA